MPPFGAHMSVAGGYHNAVLAGRDHLFVTQLALLREAHDSPSSLSSVPDQ